MNTVTKNYSKLDENCNKSRILCSWFFKSNFKFYHYILKKFKLAVTDDTWVQKKMMYNSKEWTLSLSLFTLKERGMALASLGQWREQQHTG